jgi:hypothetical protein
MLAAKRYRVLINCLISNIPIRILISKEVREAGIKWGAIFTWHNDKWYGKIRLPDYIIFTL